MYVCVFSIKIKIKEPGALLGKGSIGEVWWWSNYYFLSKVRGGQTDTEW